MTANLAFLCQRILQLFWCPNRAIAPFDMSRLPHMAALFVKTWAIENSVMLFQSKIKCLSVLAIKNTTETGAGREIHVCVYLFGCSCSMRLLVACLATSVAYTNFASSSILLRRDIVSRIKWQSAKVISWCWTWIPTGNLVAGVFSPEMTGKVTQWKCDCRAQLSMKALNIAKITRMR